MLTAWIARIASGGCAILLVALIAVSWRASWLNSSIEKPLTGWRAKLEQARTDLTVCRSNNASLQTGINAQNQAVDALASESAARTAEASRRALQARQEAQEAQRRADGYLAARSTGEPCADALALVRGVGQ